MVLSPIGKMKLRFIILASFDATPKIIIQLGGTESFLGWVVAAYSTFFTLSFHLI